ncbi:MAG: ABC transporter permease subunit [Acidaminobacter sp.]|uniref:ABC transporter permease n=1 Tax=Acidaminobacter sp. TaxID=1872102 RepID=UPI00137C5B58|nr:ABC transporter permease [Acidaminobacter sp.]MZQ99107.1 ABC transporter permease subunit [Acidaminobacter sp.]
MKETFLKARVGLTLGVLGIVFLPLGTFRPNRVVRGIPLDGEALLEGRILLALAATGLVTAAVIYALREREGKLFLLNGVPWMLSFVPGLLMLILSSARPVGGNFDLEVARMSLSSGYWLVFAGILMLQSGAPRGGVLMSLTVLISLAVLGFGLAPHLALYKEFMNIEVAFYAELRRHLTLSLASVVVALLPGILLGYICHRHQRLREWILGTVNLFQVAPTLSLLGLIMIPLTFLSRNIPLVAELGIRGVGFAPAFIILTLYCLLPITANAFSGFDQVETAVVDSALAMGMTRRQIFRQVLFPLALPVIFSGIRTAVTQNVGNTILAGLIGGGGMGALIFLGLSQSATDLVILGTIPVVLMALILDAVFKLVEERMTQRAGVTHDTLDAGI